MILRNLCFGGRLVRRTKAATSLSIISSSGPQGPLCFLYPRWIQTAVETMEGTTDDSLQPLSMKWSNESHKKKLIGTEDKESARFVRRVVKSIEKRAARKLYNGRVREEYREWKHLEANAPPPDWRKMLHGLENHTPDQSTVWHGKALRILVPVRAADQLLFSQDDNIWAIKDEFGCHIDLSQAGEHDEGLRTLLLSGTATGIAKAATKILRIVPKAVLVEQAWSNETFTFSTESPGGTPVSQVNRESKVRYVMANPYRSMVLPLRADMVKRPPVWTPTSFGNYVRHLTQIEMSAYIHGTLYKPGENHYDAVASILKAIFADPHCQEAISVTALNDAIAYLTKHNYIKTVREIFVRVEMLDLKVNTSTFNIMLRGAAKSEDLATFNFILSLMQSRGCLPDGHTWLAFFTVVRSIETKLRVLAGMRRKGLLNDITLQRLVCEKLVVYDIETALDENLSQKEFQEKMTERYGSDWLTVSIANRILNVLASRGLLSRCWEMLEYMDAQNITPNSVSINTLLGHCAALGNLDGVMEIVHRLFAVHKFTKIEHTYKILFDMAWSQCMYAVARVVWRYACLDAATNFRMRKRISDSIRSALRKTTLCDTHWNMTAGSFILGVTSFPPSQAPSLQIPSPNLCGKSSMLPALKSINTEIIGENTKVRKGSKQNIVAAMQTNLDIFRVLVPTPERPFADVLLEAFELDKEWRALRRNPTNLAISQASVTSKEAYDLEWLSERAPTILLRKRVGSSKHSRPIEWK